MNEQIMSSAGENWRRRWEEAMLRRASQLPAVERGEDGVRAALAR